MHKEVAGDAAQSLSIAIRLMNRSKGKGEYVVVYSLREGESM